MRSDVSCSVEFVKLAMTRIDREDVPIGSPFDGCVVGYAVRARVAFGRGFQECDIGYLLVFSNNRVFIPVRRSEVRMQRGVTSHRIDVQVRAGAQREVTDAGVPDVVFRKKRTAAWEDNWGAFQRTQQHHNRFRMWSGKIKKPSTRRRHQ